MNGGFGLTGQSPFAAWRSVWHTPFAITLISTSPGPGVGIGTSSIRSGLPNSCTTAPFIIFAILRLRITPAHIRYLHPLEIRNGSSVYLDGSTYRVTRLIPRIKD